MGFFVFMLYIGFFAALLILWKKVYFRPIATVLISEGDSSVVSVKPSKAFFRSLKSQNSCFYSLGDGYVAWQCSSSDTVQHFTDLLNVDSSVYIFRVKLGRFRSVTLSDRKLSDLIKKFKKVG